MKIALILGAWSVGNRPLDLRNVFNNPRGLTGTELCLIRIAQELKELNNDVYIYTVRNDTNHIFDGIHLYGYQDRFAIDDSFDAIISINEPDAFRGINRKPIRICYQMLNDFSYCLPNYDDEVDCYLGVCEQHTNHLKNQTKSPNKWKTVELGCDLDKYEDKTVKGRVIWCSSADRGLHWLLSQWSQIKQQVPYANLRIFYHFNYGDIEFYEPNDMNQHPHVKEMAQRVRYIKRAIKELEHLGVEHIGSVSRDRMNSELNEAAVFGFSADTVAFSEGFSCSTLEAHASYTLPIITDCDCLGSLYKDSGAVIIKSPLSSGNNLQDFTNAVIKGLTNDNKEQIKQCREFAGKHTWKIAARRILDIIKTTNSIR